MVKAASVFILASVLCFFVFYVAPSEIFEVTVTEYAAEYPLDLSLRTLIWQEDLPESVNQNALVSIWPTPKCFALLFVCIIGVPLLLAWRATMSRRLFSRKFDSESDSETEQ